MFCPNCGKSDQTPDSYCRSCGEFLTDFSAKAYLIKRLLGGSNPRAQVRVNLVINAVTALVSSLLLGFLNGHYDALRDRTGEAPPRVIYLVYIFLGLVMVWQFLGLVVNMRLKKKLDGRGKGGPPDAPAAGGGDLQSRHTQRSLSPGDPGLNRPESVTQHTTKILKTPPRE